MSRPGGHDVSTHLHFDNRLLSESLLDKAVEEGIIQTDDPQRALAAHNTWQWLLAPYSMITINEKPPLEDMPKFFPPVTRWRNFKVTSPPAHTSPPGSPSPHSAQCSRPARPARSAYYPPILSATRPR